MKIERFDPGQIESIVKLSLRAWEPVFLSLREAMDSEVFDAQYPNWRKSQKDAITAVCTDSSYSIWVAVENDQVVGFVALKFYESERLSTHDCGRSGFPAKRYRYCEVTYTRKDGSQLTVPFANIFKVDSGGIKEYSIFTDTSDLYK